jgi:hypothetical protein
LEQRRRDVIDAAGDDDLVERRDVRPDAMARAPLAEFAEFTAAIN